MTALDLVVGAVAIGLGILLFITGAVNSDNLQHLSKLRWLVRLCGHTGARIICVLLGLSLFALGIAIASGWKMQWS